jgi:hypothetical protein
MSNVGSYVNTKGKQKKSMNRQKSDSSKTKNKPKNSASKSVVNVSDVLSQLPSITAQSVVINVHSNNSNSTSTNDRKNKIGIAFPDFTGKLASFLK